ncbi:hypothetical protein CDAR_207151 [Caerostris darwini]|uniref:Mannose-6-phosphate isomerase n=1 Tax=Caerostris darwini TaxID=1538125 RepID=A0AAV4SN37_9ARAC|nr:hypothetical protein CDAR_207151 [Caerostris darwini]
MQLRAAGYCKGVVAELPSDSHGTNDFQQQIRRKLTESVETHPISPGGAHPFWMLPAVAEYLKPQEKAHRPPPFFSSKCDLSIAPLRSLSELSISFHPHTEATLLAASPSWNPETLQDSVDCWRK